MKEVVAKEEICTVWLSSLRFLQLSNFWKDKQDKNIGVGEVHEEHKSFRKYSIFAHCAYQASWE